MSAQVNKNSGNNPLAKAAQADRNRKILIQVGVAVVLIGLVAAIGIGLAMRKSDKDSGGDATSAFAPTVTSSGAIPANVTAGGAIRLGKADAKVRVQVVADLQCPACQMFEQANAKTLEEEVANGTASVEYNIISFLDRASNGNQYSSRAANAAYVVGSADPAKFQNWLATMFAKQPKEGGNGMTDDQLIQIATEAGYTDPAIADAIRGNVYAQYVKDETTAVFGTGLKSTPSVYVAGKQVTDGQALMSQGGLKPVIEAAAKQ
ncbi:DsbA family protein [Nocardia inohanensis]|uniref:DsbA family protein n=1 Tax=Nocardia inohanensis TaxID=209246 RepID=UPI000B1DEF6B|nr:thioredoxin domain-containing protein [Nocardia inohanensis]